MGTMALAEASGNPALASHFLTGLLVLSNFLAYAVFSGQQDNEAITCMFFNLLIGYAASGVVSQGKGLAGFGLVALQLFLQMFVSPIVSSYVCVQVEAKKLEAKIEQLEAVEADETTFEKDSQDSLETIRRKQDDKQ